MSETGNVIPILSMEGVYYTYASTRPGKNSNLHASGRHKPAVVNVSLDIDRGQFVALTGASGSGKTTLARIAAGRLSPARGGVHWDGPISFMPQHTRATVNPRMTARAAITEPLAALKLRGVDIEEKFLSAANDAGLPSNLLQRRAAHLSGGEIRKVALARALITRPPLLILDEPLVGIDLHSQAEILEIISQLCGSGNTSVLVVSHDILAVGRHADRLAVMDRGEIVEFDLAAKVIEAPQHPVTAALLASIPGRRRIL